MEMLKFTPVDTRRVATQAIRVHPHRRWETRDGSRQRSDDQATTRDGVPQWAIKTLISSGNEDLVVEVIVPAAEEPEVSNEPVEFEGLSVKAYPSNRDGGSVGGEYYAQAVMKPHTGKAAA